MPSLRINKNLKDKMYFLTFTIVKWIDIFTSSRYSEIPIRALKFYQKEYRLKLYGYVIMTNHMHLLAECSDMIKFVSSFKSFTAKEIIRQVKSEKRKYILSIFEDINLEEDQKYQVWQKGNWPELVEEGNFFNQKLNYIHENPLVAGYVEKEEDWCYSSARNYFCDDHSVIRIIVE